MRFLLLLAACLPAFAAEVCPWLNAATAGGVLGGPISQVKVSETTCTFVRRDASLTATLRIDVETMRDAATQFPPYAARCHTTAAPLKAIGNQALACTDDTSGERGEQVVGRVRENAFVVRVSTSNRAAQPDDLRDKVRKVAEQVAGVLF